MNRDSTLLSDGRVKAGAIALGTIGAVAATTAAVTAARRSPMLASAGASTSLHSITIGREHADVQAAFEELASERSFVPIAVDMASAPMSRGTEVQVEVSGGLRNTIMALRGESPAQQARRLLRDLKAELECGQALRVEPQPDGRSGLSRATQRMASDRLKSGGRL